MQSTMLALDAIDGIEMLADDGHAAALDLLVEAARVDSNAIRGSALTALAARTKPQEHLAAPCPRCRASCTRSRTSEVTRWPTAAIPYQTLRRAAILSTADAFATSRFIDWAWRTHGFNGTYWQGEWGFDDVCNVRKPLARCLNAIWLLNYSAEDYNNEAWNTDALHWGGRYVREQFNNTTIFAPCAATAVRRLSPRGVSKRGNGTHGAARRVTMK